MPTWNLAPVDLCGVAVALPKRVVTNADLCAVLDSTPEWIEQKIGVLERRFLDPEESLDDLMTEAAAAALAAGELSAAEVDVVVTATSSPDYFFPSVGITIADRLGIDTSRIVDLTQYACAASTYALHLAACLLQEQGVRTALIVCGERVSGITDPTDRTTRIFFGDAAAATVLRRTESGGLLAYDLGHSPHPAVNLATPWWAPHAEVGGRTEAGRTYMNMDGKVVWDQAITHVPASVRATLGHAGLAVGDIAGFALHQANVRLVREIGKVVGVDPARVPITGDVLGNTGAASPLTSLYKLATAGLARRDDVIVLGAIGSGFFWGSLCFRLGADLGWAG
ncbi:ketoacyl-ACP synthase III [Nocardia takedensis]|uniref:ketoacyl-ACP synthase III n=1 Tax=Nocardia takedensis TaxID=259390 RepID=UPI0002F1D0DA|nr:ketoacyl-ACP synthase III [Nocardia takedensis]